MTRNLEIIIGAAGERATKEGTDYYIFDPRPDSISTLKGLSHIEHYPIGLYSSNTTLPLYITKKGTCSSIYKPNIKLLEEIAPLRVKDFTVVEEVEIEVKRLDSIVPANIGITKIKLDTQGSELEILKGAGDLLYNTEEIVVEVEFKELYIDQPLEEEVKRYLEIYGFEFDSYSRRVGWDKVGAVFADAKFINKGAKKRMNLEEYNTVQSNENYKQVAIDFDGVIHGNSKGFYDGTVYDSPIVGSLEAIKELHAKGFTIVVFTAKAKPDRPLINGKTGAELVWEWLAKHKVSSYIKEVTSEKPRAITYIDDKGLRFTDWNSTLNQFYEIANSRTKE